MRSVAQTRMFRLTRVNVEIVVWKPPALKNAVPSRHSVQAACFAEASPDHSFGSTFHGFRPWSRFSFSSVKTPLMTVAAFPTQPRTEFPSKADFQTVETSTTPDGKPEPVRTASPIPSTPIKSTMVPVAAVDEDDDSDDADDDSDDKDAGDDKDGDEFKDDLDDDDDVDEFGDIDEDDFDDSFDDDFEEELEDDYEIEIDDEISAEFGLNTGDGSSDDDLDDDTEDVIDDDLDDFEDFENVD